MTDIPDRLCTLVTEHLGCADRFSWEADLRDDLGADELDTVELVMAMEMEFGFDIPDHTAARWNTPGDMLKTLQEMVG